MRLTRHHHPDGPRWAVDGEYLGPAFSLSLLAQATEAAPLIAALRTGAPAEHALLAPIDADQELWAAGVTYMRSMNARVEESDIGARLYQHIYESQRPELFFKAVGRRVVGDGQPIRVRADSEWDVPEPEMVLVVNSRLQIIGYTAGNDVSSRSIEGENALYLPQAKIFDGSAAIGAGITLASADDVAALPIELSIQRDGKTVFSGDTNTDRMKQKPTALCDWLGREMTFPGGALLMTGTGIVPGNDFTLTSGDVVAIRVGDERLTNHVA